MTDPSASTQGTHPDAWDECPEGGKHCPHWYEGVECCYCEDE